MIHSKYFLVSNFAVIDSFRCKRRQSTSSGIRFMKVVCQKWMWMSFFSIVPCVFHFFFFFVSIHSLNEFTEIESITMWIPKKFRKTESRLEKIWHLRRLIFRIHKNITIHLTIDFSSSQHLPKNHIKIISINSIAHL